MNRMSARKKVCDHALLYATAADDLSFALRMCQYVDEEGLWCDLDVRDTLCRSVGAAIKGLPETAAVTTGDGAAAAEEWKVEGTNATVEELRTLGDLLQEWLDSEMDDFDDFGDEKEEGGGKEEEEEEEEEEEGHRNEGLVVAAEDPQDPEGSESESVSCCKPRAVEAWKVDSGVVRCSVCVCRGRWHTVTSPLDEKV